MDDPILIWNEISLEANRVSHTDGSKDQNGPTLSSRALAIIHLAMYDAYAGIDKTANLPPYLDPGITSLPNTPANIAAAVAGAAYTTLISLYPNQLEYFNQQLVLHGDVQNPAHNYGVAVADKILAVRQDDPGASQGIFRPVKRRGIHKVDPDNPSQGYHAPFYGAKSNGFAVSNPVKLKLDAPPFGDGEDKEYLKALKQVRAKGIKPELMATLSEKLEVKERTPEETLIGLFWGYDGTAGLGTPPRFYNQIIKKIAIAKGNTPAQNARLFALINTAMGDAGILCWKEKYIHQLWRPVVGIREHDPSFGARDKGQPVPAAEDIDKHGDPFWLPFGAPSSNSANAGVPTAQGTFPFAGVQIGKVKNFTPNFPSYPSGHATFGAAAFHITRLFYGIEPGNRQPDTLLEGLKDPDGNDIFFISEELNEKTQDNNGTVRPLHRRKFDDGLWGLLIENGLSRVFLGVHWNFDSFALKDKEPDLSRRIGGVWLGLNIAEEIYKNGLQPAVTGTELTLYAPTMGFSNIADSELVFNSRSPRFLDVTPTFYTAEGKAIVGATVTLQPNEIRFTSIESLIPAESRTRHQWGGLALSYYGQAMELAAQMTLRESNQGGSIDSFMPTLDGQGSETQEAVWRMPKHGTAVIALGNSSDQPIQTTLQFSDGSTEQIEIAPFATQYVERNSSAAENENQDEKKPEKGTGESVKLISTGLSGSLKVLGYAASKNHKFTSSIRFYDPNNVAQPNLYATNFKPKDSSAHLLLKNTTANMVTAAPRFLPLSGENALELPAVTVPANGTVEVDLQPLLDAAATRDDLNIVSVQIINTGGAGSLIGALYASDTATDTIFDIPLRDGGTAHHSTGVYPLRLDGDYETILSITNVADEVSKYRLIINYDGGQYALDPQELAVGGTVIFDIRKIRDEQVPDSSGGKLPLNITNGQIRWSLKGDPAMILIGRAEIISAAQKVNSSYSCTDCCPNHIYDSHIGPGETTIYVGGTQQFTSYERDQDCHGNIFSQYSVYSDWTSSNEGSGTVGYNNGLATGVGVGTTQLTAEWTGDDWWLDIDSGCTYIPTEVNPNVILNVEPRIRILRDGVNISDPATLQHVIVGQRINLTAEINGGETPSSISWTIPEKAVKSFKVTATTGGPEAITGLTTDSVNFIWHNGDNTGGANKQVELSVVINSVTYTATAEFEVKIPTTSLTSHGGAAVAANSLTPPLFALSGVTSISGSGQTGIVISKDPPMIPTGFSGNWQFVQLISGSVSRNLVGGGTSPATFAGLDGCYPYTNNESQMQDSPGFELSNTVPFSFQVLNGEYNATWNVYLMFKPTGTNSDWVPIQKLIWSWYASVALDTGSSPPTWTATNISGPGSPSGSNTTDYPTWTSVQPDPNGC